MIVFALGGTDRLTGAPVQFESRYAYFGLTDVYFPTVVEDETNPTDPTSNLQLSLEAFLDRYPNGVESFIGTLYGFTDQGEIVIYDVFSRQNDEALLINREDGTYTQILAENGQYTETLGNLNANETASTSTDEASFLALSNSISFINFDAFNATNLTSLTGNDNDGVYQVNIEAFDDVFNLPIDPSLVITDTYVEIRSDYLLVLVYAFNEETQENVTYYLVLEALNLDVSLLGYLK
jgi:hypothetical protein